MRTGSVAMWQVMRELVLKDGGRAPKLGTNFFDEPRFGKWAKEKKYILVKSHQYENVIADYVDDGLIKVVVTIRDMRDVIVSLINFNNYGFKNAIAARAFRGNPKNYFEWLEEIPPEHLYIVKYEDFITDRPEIISKVSNFLDIDISDYEAVAIGKKWDIPANRKRAKERHNIDSPHYMSERHIHSGEVGQWRTALSKDEVEYIEEELWDFQVVTGYTSFHDEEE